MAPRVVFSGLALMKDKGEVLCEKRFSPTTTVKLPSHPLKRNCRQTLRVRKSPSYFIGMIISLEPYVLDESVLSRLRCYAWTLPLRVWASLDGDNMQVSSQCI